MCLSVHSILTYSAPRRLAGGQKNRLTLVLILAEELPGLLRILEFEEFPACGVRMDFDSDHVNVLVLLLGSRFQIGQCVVFRRLVRDFEYRGSHRLTVSALVMLDKFARGCGRR